MPEYSGLQYEDIIVLFGRQNKGNRRPPHLRGEAEVPEREFYTIDFDMMVKGSIYKRRNGMVRQFGVTVNGSTRLVTSGDVVDRATYRALLQAGAVKVPDDERAKFAGKDIRSGGAAPIATDPSRRVSDEDDLDEGP